MTANIANAASETAVGTFIPASTQQTDIGKLNRPSSFQDQESKHPDRFQSIQVLRAIAAIAVVLFHIRAYLKIIGDVEHSIFSVFTEVFANGATLFFCISGFLMAHLISTGYRNFLPRRLLRIYPTFFIAVALALLLRTLAFGYVPQPNLLAALTLLPLGHMPYPLNIEWTLIYEVFFYFVCTIFTFQATKKFFPAFLISWLIVIVAAWVLTGTPQLSLPTYDTIFFQTYNIYFITGGLTYYLAKSTPPLPKAACVAVTPVIIASIFLWPILKTNSIFWKYEIFIFALYAMATLLVALSMKIDTPGRTTRIMMKIGDYSYGIYLIHAPIIITIFYYYKLHFGTLNSIVAVAALVTCMACGCWLGKLDLRIHQWMSSTIFPSGRRPKMAAGSGTTMNAPHE